MSFVKLYFFQTMSENVYCFDESKGSSAQITVTKSSKSERLMKL